MKTREQAEARAMEFAIEYVDNLPENWKTELDILLVAKNSFIRCFDEMTKHKDLSKTCGYCFKLSKEKQKELLCEMMRKDEENGIYESNEHEAACYLEESGISGNTMIDVDEGSVYLHDVLTGYKKIIQDNKLREAAESSLSLVKQVERYGLLAEEGTASKQLSNEASLVRNELEKALEK